MAYRIIKPGWQRGIQHALALALLTSISLWGVNAENVSAPEDVGKGITSSVAVDARGNLHVVYLTLDAKVYYAFRPVDSGKWFKVAVLDSTHSIANIYPRVAVDGNGRPHMCVAFGELKYITFRDQKLVAQTVDPGSGTISYHCSIALADDGTPHLSWYHEFLPGGKQFTHFRHAELKDGTWVVRSIDGGISGKWNSMLIDSKGFPHVSYSQFAAGGDLRYAEWDGNGWKVNAVDSSRNASTSRGYDNSLALGSDGSEHISYLDDVKLKYAHRKQDGKWTIDTVTNVYAGYDNYAGSTSMLLDNQGTPHIIFGDFGGVIHAFMRGDKWETETIVTGAAQQYPNVDAARGPDGKIYVTYPDPEDGIVKLVTFKPAEPVEQVKADVKPADSEKK